MIQTMCLGPLQLMAFVGLLDPSIVEMQGDDVLIYATEGVVEWVYLEDVKIFAIDGDRNHCFGNDVNA